MLRRIRGQSDCLYLIVLNSYIRLSTYYWHIVIFCRRIDILYLWIHKCANIPEQDFLYISTLHLLSRLAQWCREQLLYNYIGRAPGFELLPVLGFKFSLCIQEGFPWALWFPPTFQTHTPKVCVLVTLNCRFLRTLCVTWTVSVSTTTMARIKHLLMKDWIKNIKICT